jgi:cell wall-associated NlpC family hydrolase
MSNWVILRNQVVEEAKSFVGTPYHHGQSVKYAGVDCVTLLILVFRTVGLVPADFNPGYYSTDWYLHKSEELYMGGVEKYARRLMNVTEAQPGDVALYKIGRCVSHGGILIGDGLLVHANRKARQVEITELRALEHYLHSYWTPFPP